MLTFSVIRASGLSCGGKWSIGCESVSGLANTTMSSTARERDRAMCDHAPMSSSHSMFSAVKDETRFDHGPASSQFRTGARLPPSRSRMRAS